MVLAVQITAMIRATPNQHRSMLRRELTCCLWGRHVSTLLATGLVILGLPTVCSRPIFGSIGNSLLEPIFDGSRVKKFYFYRQRCLFRFCRRTLCSRRIG